jgi:hypothetical protein
MIYNLDKLPFAVRGEILKSAKMREFFSRKPESMLTVSADAKTVKGEKKGFLTGILYLISSDISGANLCPLAKIAACDLPCLVSAGRGRMSSVFFARLRKTLFFLQYNKEACDMIKDDIRKIERKAKKQGFDFAIRLNGTSDIRFERYDIIQAFPHVTFYDYTKIANRKNLPANYDITFSYSGLADFAPHVKKALENGLRVAAVFRNRETVETMLQNGIKFLGRDIIDGDETDLRFLEPKNAIVALYAKGRAKYDGSGFVIDMPDIPVLKIA